MASNLPPGVTESMIPGNRPEDEWWEQFTDQVHVPTPLVGAIPPNILAAKVSVFLSAILTGWEYGFQAGKEDEKQTQAELEMERRENDEASPH